MKLRFSLSYRDLEEFLSIRSIFIDHATIQRWVFRFSPLIESLVKKRKKPVSRSWRMDVTYIKVRNESKDSVWMYLYRAVDKYGDTIDFLLQERRDAVVAKNFFRKAFKNNDFPDKVNVDKSGSNKCALDHFNKYLPDELQIEIRQNKYLNNMIEQDHRFIKKRTKPMLGFKSYTSACVTIYGIESVRMLRKGQIIGQEANQNSYHNFCDLMANCA